VPAENPGPESHLLANELTTKITDALRKIPEEFRLPIVMVDMGDFSYAEAAEILSCPVGTIRSRLSRGRRLVYGQLKGYIGIHDKGREKNDVRRSKRTDHRFGRRRVDSRRAILEAHLDDCPWCQWAYEQERPLKKEINRVGLGISAPVDLQRKILTDHGILPAEAESLSGWAKFALDFHPFMRPAFGLVLVLLVLLPIVYLVQVHSQPISLAALEIQQKIAGGEISLRKATSQNELRDWQTRAVDGKFVPMEYDLSSMHVQPVGGVVEEINGRKILVTV